MVVESRREKSQNFIKGSIVFLPDRSGYSQEAQEIPVKVLQMCADTLLIWLIIVIINNNYLYN